ncbi:hypothetical protein WJU16_03180 [Chitinophaga pollutisoli]|uniref:DUF4304 domain-containing protein n=1 Tax=Chitinophaga pollutisoli TaxID=3133966 RepID=A0ABZ2YQH0_9BACT
MIIKNTQLQEVLSELRKSRTVGFRTVSYQADIIRPPLSFHTNDGDQTDTNKNAKKENYEINLLIHAAENLIIDKSLEKEFMHKFPTGEMVFNLADVSEYLWLANLLQHVTRNLTSNYNNENIGFADYWNKRSIYPFDALVSELLKTENGRYLLENCWENHFPNDPDYRKWIPGPQTGEKHSKNKHARVQTKSKNKGGPNR